MKNRIHFSRPELVYPDEKVPFNMDGSLCKLRQADGSYLFWTTDLGDTPYYHRFHGTAEDPFQEEVENFDWDYNGYKDTWPCGLWVQSFYQCEDGMLIGFVHREDLSHDDPEYLNNYHIGFGVSHDGGSHWKYLGDVCGNVCNDCHRFPNMAGVPYIAGKDGYFYLFFNDFTPDMERYVTAARTPIKEAVEAIRKGELPVVKKYSGNGVWDTDPMNGMGAPVLPLLDGINEDSLDRKNYDCHANAAYCSALDRYVLVVQHKYTLFMFLSEDCCNWGEPITVGAPEPNTGYCYYTTILGVDDEASADSSTVGHSFYIYFTHKPDYRRVFRAASGYENDQYYRVRVTIDK